MENIWPEKRPKASIIKSIRKGIDRVNCTKLLAYFKLFLNFHF